MKLPSGMTTTKMREQVEGEIAKGTPSGGMSIFLTDILALLVAMDLRERLDKDVEMCARSAKSWAEMGVLLVGSSAHPSWKELTEAAERVLKHDPKPDLSGAPS